MLTAYEKRNVYKKNTKYYFTCLRVAVSKIYFVYVRERNKQTGKP